MRPIKNHDRERESGMKKLAFTLLLVAALVTGTGSAWTTVVHADGSESVKQFQKYSKGKWQARVDRKGNPVFVTGVLSGKGEADTTQEALRFLEKHREYFHVNRPSRDLKLEKTEKDKLGMKHFRFQQMKEGFPVEGAVLTVHTDEKGSVRTVNGQIDQKIDDRSLDTRVEISKKEAVKVAKEAVSAPEHLFEHPVTEQVVYPSDGKGILTYKVNLNFLGKEPGNWFVYVDAKTGKVVDKYNAMMDADELKQATGVGVGVKGTQRKLNLAKDNSGRGAIFYLRDITRRPHMQDILTYDFKNQWDSGTNPLPGVLFQNKSASWKDDYHRAAVDAHYNSEMVYEYYLREHNRNSIDGKGMAIVSTVHYGEDYNNAFWNGKQMTYGDGDGSYFISLSAGLDVAAHEMTHGVTTHSAGLVYRNQPGALNEAFSDIFGALVDEDDWEIGEEIMAPEAIASGRTSLRSLENPGKFQVNQQYWPYGDGSGKYPSHMDEFYDLPLNLDNGGVHVNSSIINHGAYLAGEKIGKQKLGQIYYRALTVYLTPMSDFKDARYAVIQAATDLYGEGSAEVKAVTDAFDAVGITR